MHAPHAETGSGISYMRVMDNPKIRIASYNIRKARGMDQRKDPARVLDVINSLGADVVVLQEADHRFARRKAALSEDLITRGSDYSVVPLARNSDSLGWHGNAVLLRGDLEVLEVALMRLPGLEPRGAARVVLSGSAKLTLVAAHLGLRRRDRRIQQTAICSALPKDMPVFVAGDFNEWSGKNGFEPFSRALTLHTPGKSFPAGFALAPLDRFAASADIRVEAIGVANEKLARRASDHLPVWCDLSLPADVA